MTILLYKDGKLIVDADQPLEGVSLDNLAAILSGASDGDVIQYDATKGMWVNKGAPSSLPEVTDSDKGKYLKANESTGDPEWAPGGGSSGGVLVVNGTWDDEGTTCTLDKTWQEIYDGGFGVVVSPIGDNEVAYSPIIAVFSGLGQYSVEVIHEGANGFDTMRFSTNSASGYPVFSS